MEIDDEESNNSVSSVPQSFDELAVINLQQKVDGATVPDSTTTISTTCHLDSTGHNHQHRDPVRKVVSFMSSAEETAETQVCTDDEQNAPTMASSSLQLLGLGALNPSLNTTADTPSAALPTVTTESNGSNSNDNNKQRPPSPEEAAEDESNRDSFSFSFDRFGVIEQIWCRVGDDDSDDDDDDQPPSYLRHSFQKKQKYQLQQQQQLNGSMQSLSLHRLDEEADDTASSEQSLSLHKAVVASEKEPEYTEQEERRVSLTLQMLERKDVNDYGDDDDDDDTDEWYDFDELDEAADKVNPLLQESKFHWSTSTICIFPTDVNEWKLVKILGEGNFGQVWQAERKDLDADDDRSYALKMLSKYQMVCDGEVDCVIAEKRLLQLVNEHPFVTKLRAAWQDENLVYFLQDFLQGGELFSLMLDKEKQQLQTGRDSLLAPRKAMPETNVQFYVACLADALHYLHSKRIVYRDLKPENALLDGQGYPVLIDLGAAKLLPADCERTYTMCGTPRYVAPELVAGSDGHSFGVDHWALAVLAYEMMTGDHPFDEWEAEDEVLLFEAIAEAEYKPLPSTISDKAKDWIDQLLVKDPVKRLGEKTAAESSKNKDDKQKSELLTHPWLAGWRMSKLRRRAVKAPWRPKVADHHDSSFFDDWDHLDPVVQTNYPPLTAREAASFDPFDAV